MMDDIEPLFDSAPRACGSSIIPFAESKLGRDQGFLRAIGYDPRTPIAPGASFAADVLLRPARAARQPPQPRLGRAGGDDRRVASRTGCAIARSGSRCCRRASCARAPPTATRTRWRSSRSAIRATWCSAATHARRRSTSRRFDADIRRGHMVGTNGPVLDVTIDDDEGTEYRPGLDPIEVSPTATAGHPASSAAPWIPVDRGARDRERRRSRKTGRRVSKSSRSVDHFGTQVVARSRASTACRLGRVARRPTTARRRRLAGRRGGDAALPQRLRRRRRRLPDLADADIPGVRTIATTALRLSGDRARVPGRSRSRTRS